MNRNYFKYTCFVFIAFLFSCRSDKPEDEIEPSITITPNGGVFIINEGNYTRGNASVGYYNMVTGNVIEDLFEPINKRLLGDVFQSMKIFNGKAYLVVNNSGKIEIVNPESFVSQGTITGLKSPRYFLPVSNGKAYVSNFKTNIISIVDLSNNTVIGGIPCGLWNLTEEMALSFGKVYVTIPSSDKVYVIDTRTDVLEDSIMVGVGGCCIKEDVNGKLWVLCSGDETKNKLAGLYCINPITNKVEVSLIFPDKTEHPRHLAINGALNVLFYISKEGLFKFNITDGALSNSPLILREDRNLYGLGVDPKNGTIYLADAIGFTEAGTIFRYQADGTPLNSFKTGIGPNGFCFN